MQKHSHAGTSVCSERLDMACLLHGTGSRIQSQPTEGTTLLEATDCNMQDRQPDLALVRPMQGWGCLFMVGGH